MNLKAKKHNAICEYLTEVYIRKNKDYGDSFAELRNELGGEVILVRLGDKYKRLCQLLKNPGTQQVKDESIEDTLMDLANYAIMELVERRISRMHSEGKPVNTADTTNRREDYQATIVGTPLSGRSICEPPVKTGECSQEFPTSFNTYESQAMRTAKQGQSSHSWMLEAALGLAGETGELLDHIKKAEFQGHKLDYKHMINELGDILWYITLMAKSIGYTLGYIAKSNIDKLLKRYPKGFDSKRSLNREE